MSKISKDELWKGFVGKYFDRYMKSTFKKDAAKIDWSKGWELMDKEMIRIFSTAKVKLRKGDLLVKVWLKNGKETWIMVYLEFQGYVDWDMGKRADTCYYRIKEMYGRPVAIQIIYTDDNPNFNIHSHKETCLSTSCELKFPTFKLLEHPPETYDKMDPLFAIIMEVAWYGLKKNKLNDKDLGDLKFRLIRKLKVGQFNNETIRMTFGFIKHYVRFEKTENLVKFEKHVYETFKNDNSMDLEDILKRAEKELVAEIAEERGIEIGEKRGEKIGEKRGEYLTIEIIKRLQKGEGIRKIATDLKTTQVKVKKIKKEMNL